MNWKRCRKRPIEVEFRPATPGEKIATLEGIMIAGDDYYIIRGIKGEMYPIRGEIFRESYEEL